MIKIIKLATIDGAPLRVNQSRIVGRVPASKILLLSNYEMTEAAA